MSKVLYITANPKQESKSFGLRVGREFINEYKKLNKDDVIEEINLFDTYVPMVDKDILNAWEKLANGTEFQNLKEEEKNKVAAFSSLTDQFINADKYVIVTPIWNFTIPAVMKAYLDTVCVAGKTFKYTENGPVGLLQGKKVIHVQASGGFFSEEPGKNLDFGTNYIRTIMNFIGITDYETIYVEGMNQFPERAESFLDKAINNVDEVVLSF